MTVPGGLSLLLLVTFIFNSSSQVIREEKIFKQENELVRDFIHSLDIFGVEKYHNETTFLKYISSFHTLDQIKAELNVLNVSDTCEHALMTLVQPSLKYILTNNISGLIHWLVFESQLSYYIDAWPKPPSRILFGNTAWYGAYDECKKISSAHYCLANTLLMNITGYFGTCVPKACSGKDVYHLLQFVKPFFAGAISFGGNTTNLPPIHCNDENTMPTATVLFILLFSVLAILCFLGTSMEILQDCFTPEQLVPKESFVSDVIDSGSGNEEDNRSDKSSIQYQRFDTQVERTRGNAFTNFLMCFSVLKNSSSILSTHAPPGVIGSLNGIRAISMTWVILGHVYFFAIYVKMDNLVIAEDISQRFTFQAVANAYVSVDSFFLLSGTLVSYLALKKMDNSDGSLGLPMYYLHRFIRLTPSYMFSIFLYDSFYPQIIGGPLGIVSKYNGNPNCKKYWWTNLLYINNFYPSAMMNECLGWSWYLANDMQFYVISPIFLYIMYRFKLRGAVISTGIGILICVIINGAIVGDKHLPALLSEAFSPKVTPDILRKTSTYADEVYIKPYTRIAPYLVGLLLGYIISRKVYISRKPHVVVALFGWMVAFGIGMSVIYGPYTVFKPDGDSLSSAENVLYAMLSRLAWSLALAWVIYACHNKMGGIINRFLSWKLWIPLSRLTYGAYLLHPIILNYYYNSLENPFHFQDFDTIFRFISVVVVAYSCSFIMALMIDIPVFNLERSITKHLTKNKKEKI